MITYFGALISRRSKVKFWLEKQNGAFFDLASPETN
jgi:hypothetical protein